jgi:hemoglobin
MLTEEQILAAIGEEGFTRLVAAFYRQIPADDILGPMYRVATADDAGGDADRLAAAEARLRDFLIFRFGGSQRYIERRGHPALRMRHFKFEVNTAARDRWVALMDRALDEAAFAPEVGETLRAFFRGVASFLINTPNS